MPLQLIDRSWRFVGTILPVVHSFAGAPSTRDEPPLYPLDESTFIRLTRTLLAALSVRFDDATACMPALLAAIRGTCDRSIERERSPH